MVLDGKDGSLFMYHSLYEMYLGWSVQPLFCDDTKFDGFRMVLESCYCIPNYFHHIPCNLIHKLCKTPTSALFEAPFDVLKISGNFVASNLLIIVLSLTHLYLKNYLHRVYVRWM